MTTQTVIFDGLPTGLTLSGKVFDVDTPDTEVTVDDIDINEGTNAKGRYSVAITDGTALSGDYDIRLFVGSVPFAVGTYRFAGTDGETAPEAPVTAALDSATQLQLNSIEDGVDANTGYLITALARLGSWTGTGINTILGAFRALAAKATGLTPSDISTGNTFDNTADSLEAVSDKSGGSGGGTATLEKQEEILAAIDDLSEVQLAAVQVDVGTISGFPETLIIGDSYSEDTGRIRINITDNVTEDPIDSLGSLEFTDADVTFTAFRPNDSARIIGTCEYVREPSSGTLTASYVLVTLLTSETAKGKAEYTYEGRLKFVWQGPSSSDETDEEQKTYKTLPFKFIANP